MPVVTYTPDGGEPRTFSVSDSVAASLRAAAARDGATVSEGNTSKPKRSKKADKDNNDDDGDTAVVEG